MALALGAAAGAWAQSRSITNALVLHLPFDGTLNDDSGRGNNATYVGNAGLVISSNAPTFVSGKLGQGFQFNTYPDGSFIEYATLGQPADLLFSTNVDFTIAFWVKTANSNLVVADPAYMANRNWNSSSSQGWGVFMEKGLSTMRVQMTVLNPKVKFSEEATPPAGETIYDSAWHHLAFSCVRGGNVTVYIDGVPVSVAGYSASTATLDTDGLSDNGIAEAINIGQDGTGTYTQSSSGDNPPAVTDGDAGVTNAVIDDVGVWRRALSPIEMANIFYFGQGGTNLFNVPDVTRPVLTYFTPFNGAASVSPIAPTVATIVNQTTSLDPASVKLYVDGIQVTPALTTSGATNSITSSAPFLLAPLSQHTNMLVFADNAPTPSVSTNFSVYTIYAWTNIYLPTPLYSENFDELAAPTNPPAVYPTGWSVQGCTDPAGDAGTWNLADATSDAYTNWEVVPINVVAQNFNYDGRILNENGIIVVNGNLVPALGSNNICIAASDQRNGNQVDYLLTGDYNLTSQTNVWMSFYSMYSQENFQLAAVEYSIDQGTTWLPVLYMLSATAGDTVITNGVLDAYDTMTTNVLQIPYATDCGYGNTYGAFVGVDPSLYGTLGPYIRLCTEDDHYAYHRVEQFRLSMADGQSTVRFRFSFAGANFWDWAIDNFSLYALPISPPALQVTSIAASKGNVTVHWNGSGINFSGLQQSTDLTGNNWVDIPGTIGLTNYTAAPSAKAVYYRARKF